MKRCVNEQECMHGCSAKKYCTRSVIYSHYSELIFVCLLQVTHTEETLASNTWSLMLKEVLGSLLKAPEGLFSGLTLLSELLPLPLPMQSTQVTHSILLVTHLSCTSFHPLMILVLGYTLIVIDLWLHR